MNEPQSANVILERKIRGHLPVTRFAVSDAGSAMLAMPDRHKPRLYHLGKLSDTGDWEEIADFSVEKITSWDLSPTGETLVAATNDDLYVFRGGRKTRLLTDRRDIYVAVSIDFAGDAFAVASADMLMSAYSVTLLTTDGRTLWTKDLPVTLTSVQISPDGSLVAAGSEEGIIYLLDAERRVVWQFDAGEPISTVCVPCSEGLVIIGSRSGSVAAIRDGAKQWEAAGDGPVSTCAATTDGKVVAVARDGDDDHTIECLNGDGKAFIQHGVSAGIASVACSHDGRYLAVTCRDGGLEVIETQGHPSRMADAQQAAGLYESALTLVNRDEYADAVSALVRALDLDPANIDAALKLAEAAYFLVDESLRLAEKALVEGSYSEAVDRLDTAWQNCIYASDKAAEVLSYRRHAADRMVEHARELAETDAVEDAIEVLNAVLRLDFTSIAGRELLDYLEHSVTDRLVCMADEALSSGQPAEAVRLLTEAYDRHPSDAIREKLSRAQCEEALAEGLALYEAKKYSQAAFQFRKVLSVDPTNEEALKRIEYAERLTEDDTLFDRFSRLE